MTWASSLAVSWAIVFGAGIVRGFAGFGFSALCVAAMSLFSSPAAVVPVIFLLEVLASLSLLPEAWRGADRNWLSWLIVGNALCIPIGIALLAWLPEDAMRLLIGLLLLAAAVALRGGLSVGLRPSAAVRLATGMVSGFINGLAAIGGIAVAVLLSTTSLTGAALRATMILLFLFTDLYALACAALVPAGPASESLVGWHTLERALLLCPAMLVGIWLGRRGFAGVAEAAFRRRVLELLMLIAALSVLRALMALVR